MVITREDQEARELEILAPYATFSARTRGRNYPDDEDVYRTVYQKDRDRIIHTTAFRRLEYKTQVFVNYEGDYYRTRLTHTIEVAQIGRSVARALGANEDLVEGICLSHDLGHSPFGHSGEHILAKLMDGFGGFDHNRQTYRIVTELEERYPGFPGLNLSYELLEGIAKHETKYDLSNAEGYDPNLRGSLEAQIANISDETAYNAHDLDDGLRSGLLNPDQLNDLEIWRFIREQIGWDGRGFNDMWRHRMIRRLLGMITRDVIKSTGEKLAEVDVKSLEDIQKLPTNVICNSPDFERMNSQLKEYLYANMYFHYRVVRMAEKAQRIITDLFEAYLKQPRQLPPETYKRIDKKGLHCAISDYIAGMTDRYAIQEWERLYDPFTRP
jgi:dGTPase